MKIKFVRRRVLPSLSLIPMFIIGLVFPVKGASLDEKAYFELVTQFLNEIGPFMDSLKSNGLKEYSISDLKDGAYLKDQESVINGFTEIVDKGREAVIKYNSIPVNKTTQEMDQKITAIGEIIGNSASLYKSIKEIRHQSLVLNINSTEDENLLKKVIQKEDEYLKSNLVLSINQLQNEMKKALTATKAQLSNLESKKGSD